MRRLVAVALLVSAHVAATAWLLAPISLDPARHLFDASSFPGGRRGHPDLNLNGWILAWGQHALGADPAHFFDAPIFHPQPAALAYSEHLLGLQPFFAPLHALSGNLAFAMNATSLLTFVLSGLAMSALAWSWWRSPGASALAGVLWAFAPWRFAGLLQMQTLSVQYLPLLVWAIARTRTRRTAGLWLAIAGLAFWQALCSFYLGYLAFLCAGLWLGVSLLREREARMARALFAGSALGAAALAMLPVALPYLGLAKSGELEARSVIFGPLLYLWNTLYPLPLAANGAPSHRFGLGWGAWLGVPLLALAGCARAFAPRGARAPAAAATAPDERTLASAALALVALCGWLALGPHFEIAGLRLGAIHDALGALVPGWSQLRVSGRFAIGAWLGLGLLATLPFVPRRAQCAAERGVGTDTPETGTEPAPAKPGAAHPGRRREVLAAALTAALLASAARIELRTLPPPEQGRDLAPQRWLAQQPPGRAVLEWPLEFGRRDSETQWLGTLHWQPLLNGYSGYRPPLHEMYAGLAASLPDARALDSLIRLGAARYLVVNNATRDWRDGAPRDWSALAAAGAALRLRTRDARVYELPLPPAPPPDLLHPPAGATLFGTSTAALAPADLAAAIELPVPEIATNGRNHWVPLRITNTATKPWPALAPERRGLVGLVWRVGPSAGGALRPLRDFSRLPADLAPGESALVRARLHPPREAGNYRLVPCLQQWGHARTRCYPDSALALRVDPRLPESALLPRPLPDPAE